MADIIDTAAEIEELQRNAALSAHRLNRNAVSAERCAECGDPIPDLRRMKVPGVPALRVVPAGQGITHEEWEVMMDRSGNAEVLFADDTEPKWYSFLAKYIGENHVVALVGLEEVSYKISELCTKDVKFAPVRSEEDRKRDESVIAIYDEYLQCATVEKMKDVFYALYDAIAAGKIPHIRID